MDDDDKKNKKSTNKHRIIEGFNILFFFHSFHFLADFSNAIVVYRIVVLN